MTATPEQFREYCNRAMADYLPEVLERAAILCQDGREEDDDVRTQATCEVAMRLARADGFEYGPWEEEKESERGAA